MSWYLDYNLKTFVQILNGSHAIYHFCPLKTKQLNIGNSSKRSNNTSVKILELIIAKFLKFKKNKIFKYLTFLNLESTAWFKVWRKSRIVGFQIPTSFNTVFYLCQNSKFTF